MLEAITAIYVLCGGRYMSALVLNILASIVVPLFLLLLLLILLTYCSCCFNIDTCLSLTDVIKMVALSTLLYRL